MTSLKEATKVRHFNKELYVESMFQSISILSSILYVVILFSLKSSESNRFSDDFRGNRITIE